MMMMMTTAYSTKDCDVYRGYLAMGYVRPGVVVWITPVFMFLLRGIGFASSLFCVLFIQDGVLYDMRVAVISYFRPEGGC